MRVSKSIVCPGCGCLCDDLDVTVEDNRIFEVANVCLWGAGKIFSTQRFHPKKERLRLAAPIIQKAGRREHTSFEEALTETVQLLQKARRPVIYGLTNSGVWGQEAALELARRVQARLEPADLAFKAPYYHALQNTPVFWTSLEVIRDEADTLVFWGANPIHSCPRHVVRYSAFSRGRFTEGGMEERQIAAVDIYRTEMAHFAHLFAQIEPRREVEFLQGVIAATLDEGAPVVHPQSAKRLAQLFHKASYGVIFVGRGVTYGPAGQLWSGLARLASELNRQKPFVLFPLSGDYNSWGLYHVLLRELASPFAPEFGPAGEVVTHMQPLDFTAADAILVTGADLLWSLRPEQVRDLKQRQVPIIVLSPFSNQTTAQARVVLPVALEGLEAEEMVYRMDGLPIRLKKVVDAAVPPAYVLLKDLAERV